MSKIWDAIIDGIIGIINFFEHIKSRPSDDEFTAEYKQHYWTCIASVVILAWILFIAWVSSQFENPANGTIFKGMRSIIDFRLEVILGISVLYVLYAFLSFFIFYKKYSQND